jgi:DNA-directed RNA polymerase specialized sigma24 family protein
MSSRALAHEPTGEELYEALLALRGAAHPNSHPASTVIFAKLEWLYRKRQVFVRGAAYDCVPNAWFRAMRGSSRFRGESAGEAVSWIRRIAQRVSVDELRARKHEILGDTPPTASSVSHWDEALPTPDELEIATYLEDLRDTHLMAFCRERFPKRGAARRQVELAYLAAFDREEYADALREAKDDRERQCIQKDMGRGRDELWLPFLGELSADRGLEDWQRNVIDRLMLALEGTRRADHGRSRGAGEGSR